MFGVWWFLVVVLPGGCTGATRVGRLIFFLPPPPKKKPPRKCSVMKFSNSFHDPIKKVNVTDRPDESSCVCGFSGLPILNRKPCCRPLRVFFLLFLSSLCLSARSLNLPCCPALLPEPSQRPSSCFPGHRNCGCRHTLEISLAPRYSLGQPLQPLSRLRPLHRPPGPLHSINLQHRRQLDTSRQELLSPGLTPPPPPLPLPLHH